MTREIKIAGVDATSAVDRKSFVLSQRGGAGIQTLKFSLQMWEQPSLSVPNEGIIEYREDASLIYAGLVRRVIDAPDPADRLLRHVDGQDYSSLAGDDVATGASALRTTQETDKARITWLLSTFGTKSITVGANVDTLLASFPLNGEGVPEMDFRGRTLAKGLDMICSVTGGAWYVDQQRDLHYFDAENLTAPWGLSDAPNGTTTFGYSRLSLPSDTIDLRNAVYVIGTDIEGWREDTASQALYGRRAAPLRAPEVTTTAELNAVGDAWLAKWAYPQRAGTLRTTKVGLRPGMLFHLTNASTGTDDDFLVQETILMLEPARPIVTVRFGSAPLNLGSIVGGVSSAVSVAYSKAVQASEVQAGDTTPPAVPTGLSVSTGVTTAADGQAYAYLQANWIAVGDADLDAYELEVDRALSGEVVSAPSASGTGGSLPAGTYNIVVTGDGDISGETAGLTVQQVELAAGERLYVNITAKTGCSSYRVYASRDDTPRFALSTSTTGSNVEVTSEGVGTFPPTYSTATAFLNPKALRTAATSITTEDVQSGVHYDVRVRAIDDSGNRSAWTSVQGVKIAPDTVAPDIPIGLSAVPGFRLVGLLWQRNTEPDLARYQVRYSTDDPLSPGNPDPESWVRFSTTANSSVVTGLLPDVLLYFQVRAVDRSGNVQTSAGDPTAIDAEANPEAGWSNGSGEYVTATPTLVGAADVAFNTVLTNILTANAINASDITAGTLTIGGQVDTPDFLIVTDVNGVEIGRWDQDGLTVADPNDTDRQIRIVGGVIKFWDTEIADWTTAISSGGVVADSIRLGTAPGGHNAIPNASFELTAFASPQTVHWTLTTDWDDGTSQVNVDDTTGDLKLFDASV